MKPGLDVSRMTPTFKEDNSKVEERHFKLQLMFSTIKNSLSTQRTGAYKVGAEETKLWSDTLSDEATTLKGPERILLMYEFVPGRKKSHIGLGLLRATFNVMWRKLQCGEDITGQYFIHTGTKIHGNKQFSTKFQKASTLQCYFRIKLFFLF